MAGVSAPGTLSAGQAPTENTPVGAGGTDSFEKPPHPFPYTPGQRLLLTDSRTETQRNEWTVLEVSPSGRVGKFRTMLESPCVFWTDLCNVRVLEVLPDLQQKRGAR